MHGVQVMNPYIGLVAVLIWVGSMAGAGWLGYDYRDGKVAKQQVEAVNDALSQAGIQAHADMEAAAEVAVRDARAVERSRKAKSEGIRDAVGSARPDCVRGAQSMRLLVAATEAANDTPSPAASLSLKLSRTTDSGGRQGLDDSIMGVRDFGAVR